MELYHITKGKYLTSILSEGLKVNSGKIGFCKKDAHKRYRSNYGMQPLFLTNDVEFIMKTMLTNNWVIKNNATLLKVTVILNDVNHSEGWYSATKNVVEPKEFRYFSNIEPKDIEIVDYKYFICERI